jgi:hypothetical protein
MTFYVMVDRVKGDGRAPPTLTMAWAYFSIIIECTSESGDWHCVCTLWVHGTGVDPVTILRWNSRTNSWVEVSGHNLESS